MVYSTIMKQMANIVAAVIHTAVRKKNLGWVINVLLVISNERSRQPMRYGIVFFFEEPFRTLFYFSYNHTQTMANVSYWHEQESV